MAKVKCGVCGVSGGHKISCATFRDISNTDQTKPTGAQIALVAQYAGISVQDVEEVIETSPGAFALALSTIERRTKQTDCASPVRFASWGSA